MAERLVQVLPGVMVPEIVRPSKDDAPWNASFVHPSMDYSLRARRSSEVHRRVFAPPKPVPPVQSGRRGIDPRRGMVILTNGIEVPMTMRELNRWGNERHRRCLTVAEEHWQKEQAAKDKLDRVLRR